MQFIFASDKDKGYGLLYCDGVRSEASQIRDKINIKQDDIDAYGFISLGVNSNQPLFFRIKKDTTYPRGAYYVHGIYRKCDPGYYLDNKYVSDMFAEFIGQEELDTIRMAEKKEPPVITTDKSLMSMSERISIDPGILKEVLVRLYSEEKLLLYVSDSLYSNDYARGFIRKIFEYLTPSLRKACTFITGVTDDDGLMPDIVLRVIPETLLTKSNSGAINITKVGHVCAVQSNFCEVVDAIIAFSDKERRDFFKWYETVFNGYRSYYQSKKFLDFWTAYRGDTVLSTKILNSYLRLCTDPKIDDVPPFIQEQLNPKYMFDRVNIPTIITSSYIDDILNPSAYLDANITEIKKIYMFMPEAVAYISHIFNKMLDSVSITDNGFYQINEAIKNGSVFPDIQDGETCPAYMECYYNAIKQVYTNSLCPRIDKYFRKKKAALNILNDFFNKNTEALFTNECVINLRKWLVGLVHEYSSDGMSSYDEEALLNALITEFDRMLAEHDKNCSRLFNAPVSYSIQASPETVKIFNTLYMRLKNQNTVEAAQLLIKVNSMFPGYQQLVDTLSKKYILLLKDKLLDGGDPALREFARTKGRIENMACDIAPSDPITALYLLVIYTKPEDIFKETEAFINNFSDNIDSLDTYLIPECVKNIEQAVRIRVEQSGLVSDDYKLNADIFGIPEKSDEENDEYMPYYGVNTRTVIDSLQDTWCSYVMPQKRSKRRKYQAHNDFDDSYNRKKSSSGVLRGILCAAIVLMAVAVTVLILYMTDIFSISQGEDTSRNVTEREKTETQTNQQTEFKIFDANVPEAEETEPVITNQMGGDTTETEPTERWTSKTDLDETEKTVTNTAGLETDDVKYKTGEVATGELTKLYDDTTGDDIPVIFDGKDVYSGYRH